MRFNSVQLLGIAAGSGAGNPGAEDGPDALRELGLVDRLVDAGFSVNDLGDIPGGHETHYENAPAEFSKNIPEVLQVNRHTYAAVRNARRSGGDDTFLLITGGDHSLAIGTLAGLADSCERLGLLWIDAHADFNTPYTSPSGNIHGMSLAVACGRGHHELRAIAESEPMIEDDDVHLFGCRDLDAGEIENLDDSDVHLLVMEDWRKAGIVASVLAAAKRLSETCDHVHMSFDIDVIDPGFVPGTGTPVAAGLTADEASTLLKELGSLGVLGSAEVVEYNPTLDTDGRPTGNLTRDLIVTLLTASKSG
ncbi:MAG: arginase [Phycisphaerae bacterium]